MGRDGVRGGGAGDRLLTGRAHVGAGRLAVLLTALLASACGPRSSGKVPPRAVNGVLDLRDWDFAKDGPVRLQGQWKFAWEKDAPAFARPDFDDSGWARIPVPGDWQSVSGKAFGYAWYRLTVLLPRSAPLALALQEIDGAYEGYCDGVRCATSGRVGHSRAGSHPVNSRIVAAFTAPERLVLAFRVSNFHTHFHGGFAQAPELGPPHAVREARWRRELVDSIVLGVLAMMALYHLLLWFGRREDRASLLFTLACGVVVLRLAATGRFLDRLWPTPEGFVVFKALEWMTIPGGAVTFLWFYRALFPEEFTHRVTTGLAWLCLLEDAFILATPPWVFTRFAIVFNATLLLVCIWLIYLLVRVRLHRRPGVGLVFLGSAVLVLAVVNDVLHGHQVIHTEFVVPYVLVFFIFCHSAVLSGRFAAAYRTAAHLSENLQAEVDSKTEALQEQTGRALQAQAEAEAASRQLQEIDRQKTEFFQNVSHELRTPLTVLLHPLDRLLEQGAQNLSETELLERLQTMDRNAHRLLRLVNQLLDFARLESGKLRLQFERGSLRELVEPVVMGFEAFAQDRGLTLRMSLPEDLPEVVVDAEKLDKVVTNLLSNACKFTEPGGSVLVKISAESDGDGHGEARIAVRDTGIGIAEPDQERIFERFRQVDDGLARRYEGSGIGLALARELLEAMGGRLTVDSELGVGSTFTAHLPLGTDHIRDQLLIAEHESRSAERALRERPAVVASTVRALQAETGAESGTRPEAEAAVDPAHDERPLVVVVEDNPDMRALVTEVCAAAFRVRTAEDGEAGLALVRQTTPALVISDIMMPGLDGHALLARLRQDPETAGIPVMLLTAKAGPEKRVAGLESGADEYLTKPFDARELLARARNLVRLKRDERELARLNQELRELNRSLQDEVIRQSTAADRALQLQRYLPPALAEKVLREGGRFTEAPERRRVTVFQCAMPGFYEACAQLSPEELTALLNSYLSALMDLAFEHGATVDQLAQDRLGGFFGAPDTEGESADAVRAARLGVAMYERARALCEEWQDWLEGATPAPTVVIHSGYAAVGAFGSSHRLAYTAVGQVVREAEAALAAVDPGQVVCSQATQTLVQGELDVAVAGSLQLGVRERPLSFYRLAGEVGQAVGRVGPAAQRGARSSTVLPPVALATAATVRQELGEPAEGQVVAGRYELLRMLGAGGMGAVWSARDQKLGLDVGIKVLKSEETAGGDSQRRLRREVRLARLVTHPNVARIFDVGEWGPYAFVSMELLTGQTLKERIERDGPVAVDEGRRILGALCAGLGAAHAAGVVHRDLKPSNVMLEPDGRVVILDFGIARQMSLSDTDPGLDTGTRELIGTPHYMAPEQVTGGAVDPRADLYALGVLGFEMLTGRKPFEAETLMAVCYLHVRQAPPDPLDLRPDLPPRLAAVLLRCLKKDPAERFASAGEVAALLGG